MVTIDPITGELTDTGFTSGSGMGKLRRRYPQVNPELDLEEPYNDVDTGVMLPPQPTTIQPQSVAQPQPKSTAVSKLIPMAGGDMMNAPSTLINRNLTDTMAEDNREDDFLREALSPDVSKLPSTKRIGELEGELTNISRPQSLKKKLINLAIQAAPIVIGGLVDGSAGVEGAAEGVGETMSTQYQRGYQQKKDLRAELEQERDRQQGQLAQRGKTAVAYEQMKALREYRRRGLEERVNDRVSREGEGAANRGAAGTRQEDQQEFQAGENAKNRAAAMERAKLIGQRVQAGVWQATVDQRGNITHFYNNRNPLRTMEPTIEGMRKAGLPAEEFATQGGMDVLVNQFGKLKQLSSAHPEWIGPIAGRAGKITTEYLADLVESNPEQADLYQTVNDISNQLVYLLSGKQINEQEFGRLRTALPHANLPVSTFAVRLSNFESRLMQILEHRQSGNPTAPSSSKLQRGQPNSAPGKSGKSGRGWREVSE